MLQVVMERAVIMLATVYWLLSTFGLCCNRHKRRHRRNTIRQCDRLLNPRLAIDAFDDTPRHLVLEEVDVFAGGYFQSHAVADDVQARIEERQIALRAVARYLFGHEYRPAEQVTGH